MSTAWETMADDIEHVASNRLGVELTEEQCSSLLNELDTDSIAKEALRGDNMDEQVEYAYDEIEAQLKKLNIKEC